MRRRLLFLAPAAVGVGAIVWLSLGGGTVELAPGQPIPDTASSVRLLPGTHPRFVVERPGVTVEAAPGAVVLGTVHIAADDVTLRGLEVVGGDSGVTVRGVEDVSIEDVTIQEARLHGIEVIDASATITGCRISGLSSPYAQGIEIRNSSTRPPSLVEACLISGSREGLLTHSARVEFRENVVRGTTMRGIAITEMSEGVMRENEVHGVTGVALYCGDMSHCEIVGNVVRDVTSDGSGVRNQDGYATVGWYYSTLRLHDNALDVPPDRRARVGYGSILTERFPLAVWPPGWKGALPAAWVAGLSLLGVALVRWAVGPMVRSRAPARRRTLARGAAPVLVAGLAVQTFHMVEHIVQVVQVYVLDAEHRSGLLGSVVDTEWVHFAYNLAVLGFLVWLWALVRPGGGAPLPWRPASWALAAVLVQGYHFLEHSAKIAQHVAWGVDPAPGLLGGRLGLIWFHFGINLAVYVAMAIPVVALLRARPADRPLSPVPERVPAAA